MNSAQGPKGGEGLPTSSLIVSAGLLATSLLSAGQALVIAFLAEPGPETDAFFAAYAIYVPLATVGVALRSSIVPTLGGQGSAETLPVRAGELIGRTWLLGATVAVSLLLLAWPLSSLITDDHSGESARGTAALVLAVLLPAASLQVLAGSSSAALAVFRRFRVSIGLYVVAGALALAVSAALLSALGITGAALGLATGAVALAGAHLAYLARLGVHIRLKACWATDRRQVQLAWTLFAGIALGLSQQLGFALACASVSGGNGSVTEYAYAYFLVGLLLNLSVLPLAIVTLPGLVDDMRAGVPDAARRYVLTLGPYVCLFLVPALVTLVSFGEPLLQFVFDSALGHEGVTVMFESAVNLVPSMLAAAVFTLGSALIVARRRWSLAAALASAGVAVYAVVLVAMAGEPQQVAIGQSGAGACLAAAVLTASFGREVVSVAGRLVWRCAPAVLLSAPIVAIRLLMGDPGSGGAALGAVLGLLTYAALASLLWRSVSASLIDIITGLVRRSRDSDAGADLT